MDGMVFTLLFTLFLGFFAGYRYGTRGPKQGIFFDLAPAGAKLSARSTPRPTTKNTDPICGNPVSIERAKPSVYEGGIYYFCSRECREIFEAAPNMYVSTAP